MKTLSMSPTSDESLRILSPQNELKSTNIQEILSLNSSENGNVTDTATSITSR